MLAEDRVLERSRTLKSNEPLLLDDPEIVWLVESGSLALYAMNVQNGISRGQRRYLFTVKAGEALFPATFTSAEGQCQILAVALEATQLMKLSRSAFSLWMSEEEEPLQQLETWIHRMGSTVAGIASPKLSTPIDRFGILGAGEVFQSVQGSITWIRILQGRSLLLGMESLALDISSGWIPLNTHLWLQATEIVELEIHDSYELYPHIRLEGLDHVQGILLKGIQQLQRQELEQEAGRFWERQKLNDKAVTTTLNTLASIFEVQAVTEEHNQLQVTAKSSEEALLEAAGLVGRSLGITVTPPAKSENLRRVGEPLEAIARASHIRTRRVTLRDGWWKKDGGPLLAFTLKDRQPVALLPASENQYEVINPQQQTRTRCDEAMAETLAPTAYFFYRSLPTTLKPLQLLKFAARGHLKELLVVLLTGIAATLFGMITPQATAMLIDQAIPNGDRRLLLQIALGLLATTMGTTLFQLTQGFAVMRLETFADAATQPAVWDRLLNLKASFFRDYAIGDLSSRVSAITQIRQKLGNTILKSLFSSVFSFLNLGLLFYYSIPLAFVALGVAVINIAVTLFSSILTLRKIRPMLDQQGRLLGMMVQIINGVSKFRVAGAETRAFAYWGRQYSHQLKLMLGTQGIEDNLAVINNLLSAITPAVLFGCAVYLLQQSQANQGSFSTGTFLAFNAAFGTFIAGATSLSTTVVDVLEVLPIWQRAQPILQATPEVDDEKADPGRLSGQLTVDRVVFRYREDGPPTLDNVSIEAAPGEFIALVGPSGSGKSTLFRLLLGFDTPESGALYYDGQDLAGLDAQAVRRQLGVVLQNSRLMFGSIFENISSNAVITMDEAWEAARMAGLADDITAMPMGMHTVVSEGGTNLSGGQRQRLIIARALALRPRILLFDEATSALDNRTQAIVSESLDRLKVTRIVVAHRLSTIRNADRIYVMQNGRVVQQGDFEELATQPGLFSQLIQRQRI
jgi:NHLM bacteriocin system ABC transporter ATP-binding protein